jgi:hypothetical protein
MCSKSQGFYGQQPQPTQAYPMSSRSQDSAKLTELATQLESQANNLNLAAELLIRYNEAISVSLNLDRPMMILSVDSWFLNPVLWTRL